MANDGWIKIHRQLLDWEWYGDPNMVALFVHLLLRANFNVVRSKGQELGRGVVATSREQLSRETGISEQSVRTCLARLKSTNEITIKTTKKSTKRGSIITINNYDKYQCTNTEGNQEINQEINQQSTNNQPTTNQQLTSSKEIKKEIIIACEARTREEFLEDFFKAENQSAIEAICMNERTTPETLRRLAGAVLDEWQATDQSHADVADAKRHLLSQIRIKLAVERKQTNQQRNNNETQPQDRYAKRRGADSAAVSPEDYTVTF